MPRSIKIAPEIDAKLYEELVSVAKQNGQSQRFVLERALEHYLHNVVPSQRIVRPEVMAAYRRSNVKLSLMLLRLIDAPTKSIASCKRNWLNNGRARLPDGGRSHRNPSSSD